MIKTGISGEFSTFGSSNSSGVDNSQNTYINKLKKEKTLNKSKGKKPDVDLRSGKRGRRKDPLTPLRQKEKRDKEKAKRKIEREKRRLEREKRKLERAEQRKIEREKRKAERREYQNWWKENTKSNAQIKREQEREMRKEMRKRDQAARKQEIKEFKKFIYKIKKEIEEWSRDEKGKSIDEESMKKVIEGISGARATKSGNISTKSDIRNEDMKKALEQVFSSKESFTTALKNSPYLPKDRKRNLKYRIDILYGNMDPLDYENNGYYEVADKYKDVEMALRRGELVAAKNYMDELEKLLDKYENEYNPRSTDVTSDYEDF